MEGDDNIPVARYGSSNVATMKKVYRNGLGHRYGRRMQIISGIHYNFSMPQEYWPIAQRSDGDSGDLQDYITQRYLGLIRNFRRHSWLLIYLFGASPAVCNSFLRGNPNHQLVAFDEGSKSMHLPYATALRMGDLGYQSNAQKDLAVCYNNLDSYIETLHEAITQPHPAYAAIGVGEISHTRQLNTSLLQIENEFYSPIRPKRVANSGEIALGALRRGGIEYIEVRSVDVNPFLPLGIDAIQIRFLDAFLLYCDRRIGRLVSAYWDSMTVRDSTRPAHSRLWPLASTSFATIPASRPYRRGTFSMCLRIRHSSVTQPRQVGKFSSICVARVSC